MPNVIKYINSSLYITTNLDCHHCQKNNSEIKGIAKYQVLEISFHPGIHGIYTKRLYSIICNNDKCYYYKENIIIKAECVNDMIHKYKKIITKRSSELDVNKQT